MSFVLLGGEGASPFVPVPKFSVLDSLPQVRARSPLYWPLPPFGLLAGVTASMPSADFCTTVRPPCDGLSLRYRDTVQIFRGKTDPLTAHPSDLPVRP